MKLSARLNKLRQEKRARPESGLTRLAPGTWLLLALCLTLAGVGTLFVLEFFVWNKVPPALAGLWEVDEGPQKGSTFEFFRSGTMEAHLKAKKKEITRRAKVSVQDQSLWITSKDPISREEAEEEGTIRELTADTLILELEKGNVLRMVRIE